MFQNLRFCFTLHVKVINLSESKVLINREMNEHDGWVASPDLPMLYLHFIVVY